MWFTLLWLSVAALCLYAGRGRKPGPWRASPRTAPSERPYLWEHETRKRKALASRIGITAPSPLRFTLERGRWPHRLSRRLGFCREFQTGNPECDTRVFILSDTPCLQQRLQLSHAMQQQVLCAFAHGVRDIRTTGAHLIARLEKPMPNPPDKAVDAILDALHALRQGLENFTPAPAGSPVLRGFAAHAFRRLPAILLIGGLITLLLNLLLGFQVIRWQALWPQALHYAALFLLAALTLAWLLFRHSAEGHAILRGFLCFTSWSACVAAIALVWFVNCYYDGSTALVYEREVVEKYTSRSRKSVSHYLRVQDWAAPKLLRVKLGKALYDKLAVGDTVLVTTHEGALGMEWISKVEHE